jgi:AbrB family looped-hinge helix DNA binding protein
MRSPDFTWAKPSVWYVLNMARISKGSGSGGRPASRSAPFGASSTKTGGDIAGEGSGVSLRRARAVDQIVIGDRGRLVLPAAVRTELGLSAGSRLLLSTEPDGSLRLRPYRAVADAGRGLLAELGSSSMVDELIAERRAAAAAEDTRMSAGESPTGDDQASE